MQQSHLNITQPNMRQFRNHGWIYLEKMQEIIPMTVPRGSHVFRPATTTSTPSPDAELGEETPAEVPDNENEPGGSLLTPPPSSIIGSDGDPPAGAHLTPQLATNPPISTSQISLVSDRSIPSTRSSQVTPTSAIVGMQGTIARLTDAMQKSVRDTMEDPSEGRQIKALQMLEEVEMGLNIDQKVELASLFTNNPSAATTFMTLKNEALRQAWAASYLAKQGRQV